MYVLLCGELVESQLGLLPQKWEIYAQDLHILSHELRLVRLVSFLLQLHIFLHHVWRLGLQIHLTCLLVDKSLYFRDNQPGKLVPVDIVHQFQFSDELIQASQHLVAEGLEELIELLDLPAPPQGLVRDRVPGDALEQGVDIGEVLALVPEDQLLVL